MGLDSGQVHSITWPCVIDFSYLIGSMDDGPHFIAVGRAGLGQQVLRLHCPGERRHWVATSRQIEPHGAAMIHAR
jgi:hypothetical protein